MTLLKVNETRIPALGSEDDLESERFGAYYQVSGLSSAYTSTTKHPEAPFSLRDKASLI